MKYNEILKMPEDAVNEGVGYSEEKIKSFIEGLGWRLAPVQGAYQKYWFTRKVEDGKFYELMNGSRYYKLVINHQDFGIECGGDYNGWSFAGELRAEIKAARQKAA